jgi:hypothetical protein
MQDMDRDPHLSLSAYQSMLRVLEAQQRRAGQPSEPRANVFPSQLRMLLMIAADGLQRCSKPTE